MKLKAFIKAILLSLDKGWLPPKVLQTIDFSLSKINASIKRRIIMSIKLTTFLIIVAFMQVSAKGYSQKVTLNASNAPLEKVLHSLEMQTGYVFFFDTQLVKQNVTIHLNNATIDDALKTCFKNTPLTYKIADKTIFIRALKTPAIVDNQSSAVAPFLKITGTVVTTHDEPLSGASVVIKRTKAGTTTNQNGEFSFNAINPNDTLIIRYVGYKTLITPAFTNRGGSTRFVLQEATEGLDQVVVQAYGKTSQRFTTGDIGSVRSTDIEKQPVENLLEALQGKVAGLDITQVNGYASAPFRVEVRGRANIIDVFSGDPLYIVDGVPLTVLEVNKTTTGALANQKPNARNYYSQPSVGFLQGDFAGPAGGQSPLFSLNPADIESVEVLKDADATAIYGSRGANGVILITTKKGKAGDTKFDLNVQEGASKVTNFWALMNTQQYLQMRNQALINDGLTPSLQNGDVDLLNFSQTSYTDWQKVLYGGTGYKTDVQASLSGGDALNTFRIGAGYDRTTNVLTVSGADTRAALSVNLNHNSKNQKFNVALSSNYTYTLTNTINLPQAAIIAPNAPPIYDANGNLNYAAWAVSAQNGGGFFPFASLLQPYTAATNFLNSNLTFNYKPVKGLNLSTNFGYSNAQANNAQYFPLSSYDPTSSFSRSSSNLSNNINTNVIIEPQAVYTTTIGKGNFTALLGGSWQQTETNSTNLSGNKFPNDALIKNISSANTITATTYTGEYRYAAIFARLNYVWESKYILSLNARRDGSSRFGTGNQFGNFGSVGAAWIFSEESWIKNNLPFLSFGKLRGSYGLTGGDAIGNYNYLSQWSSNTSQAYNGVSNLVPLLFANPTLHWQTNKKLEAAIDLGFLKDWINVSAVYYNDRTNNQLVPFPAPLFSGFSSITANSPATVQNSGWEFTAHTKIIDTKDFKWSANFNMAINSNKLLAYPNLAQSPYRYKLVIGQPLNIVRVLHYTGIDPLTGQFTFQDKSHDGVITTPNIGFGSFNFQDSYTLDLNPKYFGGFGTNFSYKNLQLSAYFTYKKQIGQNALASTVTFLGNPSRNQPTAIIGKVWQKTGDIATYPAYSELQNSGTSYFNNSDGIYTDASYIRLSNLSLSYKLPEPWLNKAGIHGLTVFAHGNNLFVITPYQGVDPETQNFGGLPPTKTIVFGLSFNL